MPNHAVVEAKLNEIEAEMKRTGQWSDTPPTDDQMDFHAAFGMDKMALQQWIQFIFIPRVREIIAAKGKFPSRSQVGDQAFREFIAYGGQDELQPFVTLLQEFDKLF